jgi:hypothetical protein
MSITGDKKKRENMIGVHHEIAGEEFCRCCSKNGPQRIETRWCSRPTAVTSGDVKSVYICIYGMSSL